MLYALQPNPSNTFRPGLTFGKDRAKKQLRAGLVPKSTLLAVAGLYFGWRAVFARPRSAALPPLFSLPEPQGHARSKGAGFPPKGSLSPAWCGAEGPGALSLPGALPSAELTLLHCVLIIYGNAGRFGRGAEWSPSKNLLQGPSSRNSWRISWITKARL